MPRNGAESMLNENIRNKCMQAKDNVHNKKCAEIEKLLNTDVAGMH